MVCIQSTFKSVGDWDVVRGTSPYIEIGRYIFTEDLNKNNAKPSEQAQTAKLRNIPT